MTPSPSAINSLAPLVILGVPFDGLTVGAAVERVAQMVTSRRPHYLATADAGLVVQSLTDTELRRLLLDAHLVLGADRPWAWASRLLGNPLPVPVSSADLAVRLLAEAEQRGWKVFLLGGSPARLVRAVERTQTTFPRLQLAGAYAPPDEPLLQMDHADLCRRIREAGPDLLLVAFGSPKQEKWIAKHYRNLAVPVTLGVGPELDFLAAGRPGIGAQASPARQRQPPSKPPPLTARRARHLAVFARAVLQQAWRLRARRRKTAARAHGSLRPLGNHALQWLQMPSHLDAARVEAEQPLWERALAAGGHLLVDLSPVTFVDSTGVGLLTRLHKVTRAAGREFALVAPRPVLRELLAWLRLAEVLPISPNLQAAAELIARWDVEAVVVVTLGVPNPDEPLAWQGEVSAANVEAVWRLTEPHLDCSVGRHESITINLAELRFLDSAGVGLMVRARKHARQAGLELRFSAPQPAVLNVIHQLRLEGYLLRKTP